MRFSVLIPAYKAAVFLPECIRAIEAQGPFKNRVDYEIILGVDGCPTTLAQATRMLAAHSPLRVFDFTSNQGPYIVRNTIASEARGEYLIFFDADDVMRDGLVEFCEKHFHHACPARFRFEIMYGIHGIRSRRVIGHTGAKGVFGIRSDSFKKLGGFKPWRCAADSDFHARAAKMFGFSLISPQPLFLYRRHGDAITAQRETAGRSILRSKYHAITKKEMSMPNPSLWVNPVVAPFTEVLR